MSTLSSQIETVAKQPLQGRNGDVQFRNHNLKDLVEADMHLESAAAVAAAQAAPEEGRKMPGIGQYKFVPVHIRPI